MDKDAKDIRKSIETSKTWSLRHRVIMHALFHQLVASQRTINNKGSMVEEYMTYSYDALTGYLQGKPIAICLSDIEVADEVFLALYNEIGNSVDDIIRQKQNGYYDSEESLKARTYISLAPVIINEYLAPFPAEEIQDCFDDILIEEEEHFCNSRQLLHFALTVGGLAYEKIDEAPEIEREYDESDEDFLSDSGLVFYPSKPLYTLSNHRLEFKSLRRIATCDGFYAPGHGCIVPTFNPRPPKYWYQPADLSTYYMNHIRKMFKEVDERSKGEEDDLQAIEYSFKTWMRIAIGKFYQGYPIDAMYVISSVITEFVSGMHIGVMSRALKRVGDFQNNIQIYLTDSLSMLLFFMDYVDDEEYDKVCKRLNLFAQSQKDDKLSKRLISLSPLMDYQNKRKEVNKPEISEEIKKVIENLGQREGEPLITPNEPRYHILDIMEIEETLDRIDDQDGPYEPIYGVMVSSFNPNAPYWIEPADPTTYYIQRLRNIFKVIEERSAGDEGELNAIQYSLTSWIHLALKNFSESNPVRALYIISAELTEFTKGISNGVIAKALESNPDRMINAHLLLKDVLTLTLYFMEYVPEEAYNKVSNRLNRFIQEYKPDPNLSGLIDFKPFVDYCNQRNKITVESQE